MATTIRSGKVKVVEFYLKGRDLPVVVRDCTLGRSGDDLVATVKRRDELETYKFPIDQLRYVKYTEEIDHG